MVGFGDGLSGGWTVALRNALAINGAVNANSTAYQIGQVGGIAAQMLITKRAANVNMFLSVSSNLITQNVNGLAVDSITYGQEPM